MKTMKNLAMILLMIVVGCLFGCGSGGDSVTTASQTLTINSAKGEHTFTFNPASDGSIGGLKIGSLKYTVDDISTITFNSNRVGYQENSVAIGLKNKNLVVIANMPNNDIGYYVARMKDGSVYEFDAKQWQIDTDKPMFFDFSDNGWMQYGEYAESYMAIEKVGNFAELTVNFGCNKLFGLTSGRLIDFQEVVQVKWVEPNGSIYYKKLKKDAQGNAYVQILLPLNDSGKLVFALDDLTEVSLNFDWSNGVAWDVSSEELDVWYDNNAITYQYNPPTP